MMTKNLLERIEKLISKNMIENEQQLGITKNILDKFLKNKEELLLKKQTIDPIEYELYENSINSIIEDLENQIKEYKK